MMHALLVLSVWLHLLAAAAWVGGSLFLVLVLVPTSRHPAFRDRGPELIRHVARRFQSIVWISFGLLAATGVINLLVYGGMSVDRLIAREFWASSYGVMLTWKLILVGGILTLSAGHDFVLGPLAAKVARQAPGGRPVARLRLALRWGGRVNLLLGIVVIGMGVVLARGWPW